jgi:hypothetical protein
MICAPRPQNHIVVASRASCDRTQRVVESESDILLERNGYTIHYWSLLVPPKTLGEGRPAHAFASTNGCSSKSSSPKLSASLSIPLPLCSAFSLVTCPTWSACDRPHIPLLLVTCPAWSGCDQPRTSLFAWPGRDQPRTTLFSVFSRVVVHAPPLSASQVEARQLVAEQDREYVQARAQDEGRAQRALQDEAQPVEGVDEVRTPYAPPASQMLTHPWS